MCIDVLISQNIIKFKNDDVFKINEQFLFHLQIVHLLPPSFQHLSNDPSHSVDHMRYNLEVKQGCINE